MSAIAGIASFEPGAPNPTRRLDDLDHALAGCGPDGSSRAEHRGAAMLFRALHLTADDERTPQPLLTGDGLLVAWDGRLDQRRELCRRLGLRPDDPPPDVELVAGAYRAWGESFLEPLVGDFALALWDAPRRRLILGRDPFAARPLFFASAGGSILWASTPRALLATGEIAPEVDDDWVASYLITALPADRSPFAKIGVVPPGHAVVFEPEGRRERRFWRLESRKGLRLKSDGEYEEAFRELFAEAVRCRLRVRGTVGAELSGGLDSSSIVCAADRLIRGGEVEAEELVSYSMVFDRAASSDEREYIRAVEERTGHRSFHVLEDDYPTFAGFDRPRSQIPSFWQLWPAARARSAEVLRDCGARALLSGFAGDDLLWSEIVAPFHLADRAARLELGRLGRALGGWHRRGRLPYPQLLWRAVVLPLWQAARGRGAEPPSFDFAWLSDRLRSRMPELLARNLGHGGGFLLPSRRSRYESLRTAISDRSWLLDEIDLGLVVTCPFLHRPLVEFCLAVPFEQLVRPHEGRSLQRRALRDLLPAEIADRHRKRGPGEAILRGLRREGAAVQALFEDPAARVYQHGYVHRERFLEQLEKARFGIKPAVGALIRVIQVEVWLRSLSTPKSSRP
jgi:asparagine synthase (glutamine-hydrolysing)